MPIKDTWGQRFALWWGYRLATRHKHVTAHPSCRLSPQARICPRRGAIDIGPHSSVALGALVQGNVTIGAHCSVQAYSIVIGYGTREESTGSITLGDYVRVAPHVMMIAANHVYEDATTPIHGQGLAPAPIVVEEDVWVGGRATILAGVTVGRGSVIGAGTVVTKDIPAFSVAVGIPAQVIKRRT